MGTTVARNEGARKLLALLEHPEAKARIGPMLAPGDDYERVVAAVMKLNRTNPELENCTGTSLLDAVATVVGWRLEIGDTAHIVPFKDNQTSTTRATPVMDYKGMAQLMIASRAVRNIDPWLVYSKEHFEVIGGSNPQIIHIPISKHAERGVLSYVYINLDLPFGARAWRYMSIEDVDVIRQRYSKQWKKGPVPPWYAVKTLLRQMAKLMPKTPALAKAFQIIRQDEEIELGTAEAAVRSFGTDELVASTPERTALGAGEVRQGAPAAEDDAGYQDDSDLDDGYSR